MLSKRIFITLFLLGGFLNQAISQTSISLGAPINSQITSEYAPSLSGNGRTMIFTATTGENNSPEVVISYAKSGIWSRPESMANFTSVTGKLAIPKDANISYDGNSIFYSASKYGGIGGTDIWFIEKTGTTWGTAVNVGKPLNTAGNEGDPSLSPDGKFLYFVRYSDKKTPTGLPCGKIYVSEKAGSLWKEPKELPSSVNMDCECSPRILVDNQTMIFSSVRKDGKGGYDHYRTQLQAGGIWSTPVPLSFINTAKDEQYVAVPAQGNFIFHTGLSKTGTDIFKAVLPENLRPKKVISIEGIVKDKQSQKPIPARIVVYDTKKKTIANITQTDAAGKYLIYLTEGTTYDFSICANNKACTFYSEFINLETIEAFTERKIDADLFAIQKGSSFTLNNIAFENPSSIILERSNFEITRIQRLLQDNPNATVEIGVNADKITIDTIPSAALTEVIIDSVEVSDPEDSTGVATIMIAKKTYHNDNTQKQADAIVNELIKKGIPKERLIAKGYGDKNPLPEPQKNILSNRRIEVKILKQ